MVSRVAISGSLICHMQILKLIQENDCHLQFRLGSELGYGSDGQSFLLKDFPGKVIKLGAFFQNINQKDPHEVWIKLKAVLDHLMNHPDPVYVKVWGTQFMGEYSRLFLDASQSYVLYFYLMEELYKLSADEARVFHSIISHEDDNKKKDFSLAKVRDMLQGMSKALDFDSQKILDFYQGVQDSPIVHHDIHARNIMKDRDGNFKLIDLDRSQLRR